MKPCYRLKMKSVHVSAYALLLVLILLIEPTKPIQSLPKDQYLQAPQLPSSTNNNDPNLSGISGNHFDARKLLSASLTLPQQQQQQLQSSPLPLKLSNQNFFTARPSIGAHQYQSPLTSTTASSPQADASRYNRIAQTLSSWVRFPDLLTQRERLASIFAPNTINRGPQTTPTSWLFNRNRNRQQAQQQQTNLFPANNGNSLLSRLANRLGARNTVRVHNAFRDIAWRIAGSMQMPTPVIYDLRRMHLYSNEEDIANDALHNSNTTKTIRYKRLLNSIVDSLAQLNNLNTIKSRSLLDDDDDDDNDDDSLLKRIIKGSGRKIRRMFQSRLTSKQSSAARDGKNSNSLNSREENLDELVGKENDGSTENNAEASQQTKTGKASKKSLAAFRDSLRTRRKRKMRELLEDKQLITINNKQFYIDDDGSLKPIKE